MHGGGGIGSLAKCRAKKPIRQHGGQQLPSRLAEAEGYSSFETCIAAAGM